MAGLHMNTLQLNEALGVKLTRLRVSQHVSLNNFGRKKISDVLMVPDLNNMANFIFQF